MSEEYIDSITYGATIKVPKMMFTKATYLALSLYHFLRFLSWKAQIWPGITW